MFQLRENCVGFLDHPAIKAGMIEDPVMAWTSRKTQEGTADTLPKLVAAQGETAAALGKIMAGSIKMTHLMEPWA